MKFLTLKFPGRFEDAFLYMGQLVMITENRSVRIYDMKHIINKLEENKNFLDLPSLFFYRNDLIEDIEFSRRFNDTNKKTEFTNAFNIFKLASESIHIDNDFVQSTEWDLKINEEILLDLNIYNGRTYIGTNAGLYHLDMDWEAEEVTQVGSIQKRIDAKCVYTTAKFGTVNASCGSDGCFSFIDDFGLGESNVHKEKQISDISLRTAWFDYDIVNYSTSISLSLFNSIRCPISQEINESRKKLESEEPDEWIITDFKENEFQLNTLFSNNDSVNDLDIEDIQFVQNSNQAIFICTYNGDLYTLGLEKGGTSNPKVKYCNQYEGLTGLVSSIHTIGLRGGGTVIETDENILVFANRNFSPIFDGEVISLRTFPRSKHYRRIVSLTTADEVRLIAIFNE